MIGAIGVYAVTFEGKLAKLRHSLLGLFIIGTLLFIYTSSKYLRLRTCIRLLLQLIVQVASSGVVDSCVDRWASLHC